MHIDALGWGILAVVVLLFGTPILVFVRRQRANPGWVPPIEVVAFEFTGLFMVIFMPLVCIALAERPPIAQPWMGIIEFLYMVACYFLIWWIWKSTSDWRWKFCLLVFSICLPNCVLILHVSKHVGEIVPRWFGVAELFYLFGGFFVFRHYFRKVR